MSHLFFLKYIVIPSCALPVVVGGIKYKHLHSPAKLIWYYAVLDGLMNILTSLTNSAGSNNHFVTHIYTAFEFLLLSLFFASVLTNSRLSRFIKIMAAVFIVLCVVNAIFFQSLKDFNAYTLALEALIMVGYSFLYFDQEGHIRQVISWEKRPLNWIVTGIMLYFAVCFFFFLFLNIISIKVSIPIQLLMWDAHGAFLMIMYILFAVGFLNERRNG